MIDPQQNKPEEKKSLENENKNEQSESMNNY